MTVLATKAMEFDEPILLVGTIGCGKTTIYQILSEIAGKSLRILNCELNTCTRKELIFWVVLDLIERILRIEMSKGNSLVARCRQFNGL